MMLSTLGALVLGGRYERTRQHIRFSEARIAMNNVAM